jgi:hypothetical protein
MSKRGRGAFGVTTTKEMEIDERESDEKESSRQDQESSSASVESEKGEEQQPAVGPSEEGLFGTTWSAEQERLPPNCIVQPGSKSETAGSDSLLSLAEASSKNVLVVFILAEPNSKVLCYDARELVDFWAGKDAKGRIYLWNALQRKPDFSKPVYRLPVSSSSSSSSSFSSVWVDSHVADLVLDEGFSTILLRPIGKPTVVTFSPQEKVTKGKPVYSGEPVPRVLANWALRNPRQQHELRKFIDKLLAPERLDSSQSRLWLGDPGVQKDVGFGSVRRRRDGSPGLSLEVKGRPFSADQEAPIQYGLLADMLRDDFHIDPALVTQIRASTGGWQKAFPNVNSRLF